MNLTGPAACLTAFLNRTTGFVVTPVSSAFADRIRRTLRDDRAFRLGCLILADDAEAAP